MNTCDLRVELPEAMTADEAKVLLAVKLFEVEKASLGQAAKLAGFSKGAFMEVLGRYGIAVFDYPAAELREEIH